MLEYLRFNDIIECRFNMMASNTWLLARITFLNLSYASVAYS